MLASGFQSLYPERFLVPSPLVIVLAVILIQKEKKYFTNVKFELILLFLIVTSVKSIVAIKNF